MADGVPQSFGSAQCAFSAVVNALRVVLGPEVVTWDVAGPLQHAMACAIGATNADELAAALFTDGVDRAQVERMLAAAHEWTRRQSWPAWSWAPAHPVRGTTASRFWTEIALAKDPHPRAAVLVGFGDDTLPGTPYEPHWTVVERIGEHAIDLRDSTPHYERVLIVSTGIRPEPGWEIEDAFLLWREA